MLIVIRKLPVIILIGIVFKYLNLVSDLAFFEYLAVCTLIQEGRYVALFIKGELVVFIFGGKTRYTDCGSKCVIINYRPTECRDYVSGFFCFAVNVYQAFTGEAQGVIDQNSALGVNSLGNGRKLVVNQLVTVIKDLFIILFG